MPSKYKSSLLKQTSVSAQFQGCYLYCMSFNKEILKIICIFYYYMSHQEHHRFYIHLWYLGRHRG